MSDEESLTRTLPTYVHHYMFSISNFFSNSPTLSCIPSLAPRDRQGDAARRIPGTCWYGCW